MPGDLLVSIISLPCEIDRIVHLCGHSQHKCHQMVCHTFNVGIVLDQAASCTLQMHGSPDLN
jgi:hypothetical protein